MESLKGKKLLVIGGAFQHCKVVEAARELGVITYVTDYLPVEKAPAKQIADKYYMHNITDIDEIVDMCKKEGINGVISTSLDACQKPYQQIAERLGLPCFGTKEQFEILTNKESFKKCCLENGVDTIPQYSVDDFLITEKSKKVEYPVLVKPCISRGSRGSSVCYSVEEVNKAIEVAKNESSNGLALIEKYMGNKKDICVTYLAVNGQFYLTRVGDRLLGSIEDKMERVSMMGMAPSMYTGFYLQNVNDRVIKMLKSIGIKNGPVFMQGFVDGNTVRFYDPGLRYPGAEYERVYEKVHEINLMKPLIEFVLTGGVSFYKNIPIDGCLQKGKFTPYLLISVRSGKICKISGLDEIRSHPSVVTIFEKYGVGDIVPTSYNVNQRFCEIDVCCDNVESLCELIDWIYDKLVIENEFGENMVFSKVNTKKLLEVYKR